MLTLNPDWRAQARTLDRVSPRGPLHGRAVLIKDNIETADRMATTAGSLALASNVTGRATTPPSVTSRTLAEVIAFNEANRAREMRWFEQDIFMTAEATKGLSDPDYLAALTKSRSGARTTLDRLFASNRVTILVAPSYGPAWLIDPVEGDQYEGQSASQLPAIAGTPHLNVPMGRVDGLPVGLSFLGLAWSKSQLLRAGDVFERARGPLPPPTYASRVAISLDPAR